MIPVIVYSRPGCHLCDEMMAVVHRVAQSVPLAVEQIDISTDPRLEEQFGPDIPVLMVNGKRAAKYRVAEKDLRRILDGRR
jgi:hypothetical protein